MKKFILAIIIAAFAIGLQLNAQSNYIRLTEHPDIDGYPVFSPKGDKIYFNSTRTSTTKTYEYTSIWMYNLENNLETEIIKLNPPFSNGTIYPALSISKNSDTLFFKEVNGLWEIYMIDLSKINSFPEIKYGSVGTEGKFKELLNVPAGNASSNVIYNPLTDELIWVANISLSGFPFTTYSIRKAKKSELNGQSTMSGGTEIFRTSTKGNISQHRCHPISLSPDFGKIVVAMILDSNGCNKCQKDLYIIDINSGKIIKQLTTDGANRVSHEDPDWSPDGQWISFTSNREGLSSIWIIRPDGTDLTRLTCDTTYDYGASWSPDSKQIAFTSVKDGNHDIYLLDIDQCLNILGSKSSSFENKNIVINKDACFDSSNKSVMICPSLNWSGGSVWYKKKFPVQQGFSTEFSFRMSDGVDKYVDEQYPGADGIAFVIQNYDNNAIGSFGGGIGFENIPNSLAIEFDTYKNISEDSEFNLDDPNENHIAVFCNGTLRNTAKHNSTSNIATNDNILDLVPDSSIFYSKIEYNIESNTLKVWLDTNDLFLNSPVIFISDLDISKLMDLTCNEYSWMGFTSSSGNAYEKHEILSWTLCNNPSSISIPNPEITSGKDTVCENSIQEYTSNINNIVDYNWIVEGGIILTGQNTDRITIIWGNNNQGKITLTQKSKDNGCSNIYIKKVTIKRLPDIEIIGNDDFCLEQISTFKANISDDVVFKWEVTGGEILGFDNQDSILVLWKDDGQNKILLHLNFPDCNAIDSVVKNISVHPLPEITINEPNIYCLKDSPIELDIASPEGGTYYGSGVTSNILFPKVAGIGKHDIYYLYTDPETNCKNTAKSKFTILPSPEKPIITVIQKKLISSPSFRYQWYNEEGKIEGAVNQEYIPDKSGQFYVMLIDENGCKSEMSEPFYFDITDVKNYITEDNDIKIYPNPASDEIIIKNIGDKVITVLEIQDVLGRSVNYQINHVDFNHILVKTKNFESGLYILTFKDNANIYRKIFYVLR
ncbi:MAG: T9SS type A sorting domain-containing protein [bacterium]